jgi:hypothetical protein
LIDGREQLVPDPLVDEDTDGREHGCHRERETESEAKTDRQAAHGSDRRR